MGGQGRAGSGVRKDAGRGWVHLSVRRGFCGDCLFPVLQDDAENGSEKENLTRRVRCMDSCHVCSFVISDVWASSYTVIHPRDENLLDLKRREGLRLRPLDPNNQHRSRPKRHTTSCIDIQLRLYMTGREEEEEPTVDLTAEQEGEEGEDDQIRWIGSARCVFVCWLVLKPATLIESRR